MKQIQRIVTYSYKCFTFSREVVARLQELGFSGYETEDMGTPSKIYLNFSTRQICSLITQGIEKPEYASFQEFEDEWNNFLYIFRRRRIGKLNHDIRRNLAWIEKAKKEIAELEAAAPDALQSLRLGSAELRD